MAKSRMMPANLVLAVCIAKTLHERDPKFLDALEANVEQFLRTEPAGGASATMLASFQAFLKEPKIIVRD